MNEQEIDKLVKNPGNVLVSLQNETSKKQLISSLVSKEINSTTLKNILICYKNKNNLESYDTFFRKELLIDTKKYVGTCVLESFEFYRNSNVRVHLFLECYLSSAMNHRIVNLDDFSLVILHDCKDANFDAVNPITTICYHQYMLTRDKPKMVSITSLVSSSVIQLIQQVVNANAVNSSETVEFNEEVLTVTELQLTSDLVQKLHKMISSLREHINVTKKQPPDPGFMKSFRSSIDQMFKFLKEFGVWFLYDFLKIYEEILKRKHYNTMIEEILNFIRQFTSYIETSFNLKNIFDSFIMSEKLQTLIKTIVNQYKKFGNCDFKCTVFVESKLAAYILSKFINIVSKNYTDYSSLKADYVVSVKNPSEFIYMTQPKQMITIDSFFCNNFNVLVTTDLGDELPESCPCDLVITTHLHQNHEKYASIKKWLKPKSSTLIHFTSCGKSSLTFANLKQTDRLKTLSHSMSWECSLVGKTSFRPIGQCGPMITLDTAHFILEKFLNIAKITLKGRLALITKNKQTEGDETTKYITTIKLPSSIGIEQEFVSDPLPNKVDASRSCKVKLLEYFYKLGLFDSNLFLSTEKVKKFLEKRESSNKSKPSRLTRSFSKECTDVSGRISERSISRENIEPSVDLDEDVNIIKESLSTHNLKEAESAKKDSVKKEDSIQMSELKRKSPLLPLPVPTPTPSLSTPSASKNSIVKKQSESDIFDMYHMPPQQAPKVTNQSSKIKTDQEVDLSKTNQVVQQSKKPLATFSFPNVSEISNFNQTIMPSKEREVEKAPNPYHQQQRAVNNENNIRQGFNKKPKTPTDSPDEGQCSDSSIHYSPNKIINRSRGKSVPRFGGSSLPNIPRNRGQSAVRSNEIETLNNHPNQRPKDVVDKESIYNVYSTGNSDTPGRGILKKEDQPRKRCKSVTRFEIDNREVPSNPNAIRNLRESVEPRKPVKYDDVCYDFYARVDQRRKSPSPPSWSRGGNNRAKSMAPDPKNNDRRPRDYPDRRPSDRRRPEVKRPTRESFDKRQVDRRSVERKPFEKSVANNNKNMDRRRSDKRPKRSPSNEGYPDHIYESAPFVKDTRSNRFNSGHCMPTRAVQNLDRQRRYSDRNFKNDPPSNNPYTKSRCTSVIRDEEKRLKSQEEKNSAEKQNQVNIDRRVRSKSACPTDPLPQKKVIDNYLKNPPNQYYMNGRPFMPDNFNVNFNPRLPPPNMYMPHHTHAHHTNFYPPTRSHFMYPPPSVPLMQHQIAKPSFNQLQPPIKENEAYKTPMPQPNDKSFFCSTRIDFAESTPILPRQQNMRRISEPLINNEHSTILKIPNQDGNQGLNKRNSLGNLVREEKNNREHSDMEVDNPSPPQVQKKFSGRTNELRDKRHPSGCSSNGKESGYDSDNEKSSRKIKNPIPIMRTRTLSYPYQQVLRPNSRFYVYQLIFPDMASLSCVSELPGEAFSVNTGKIVCIFSSPISEEKVVSRIPLFLPFSQYRITFELVKCNGELNSNQLDILKRCHTILNNISFDSEAFGKSFAKLFPEPNLTKGLVLNPNVSRINCLISIYNEQRSNIAWDTLNDIISWYRNSEIPDSLAYTNEVKRIAISGVTRSNLRLNQIPLEQWKGRIVRPIFLKDNRGYFLCDGQSNNLYPDTPYSSSPEKKSERNVNYHDRCISQNLAQLEKFNYALKRIPHFEINRALAKVCRISRNKSLTNPTNGHKSKAPEHPKYYDYPSYLLQVHPLPSWLLFQLWVMPSVLFNLENAIRTYEFTSIVQKSIEKGYLIPLDEINVPIPKIVMIPDRLDFHPSNHLSMNSIQPPRKRVKTTESDDTEQVILGYTKNDIITNNLLSANLPIISEPSLTIGLSRDQAINPANMTVALTTISANLLHNMERYRWYGETILNFASTFHLFKQEIWNGNEIILTRRRMGLMSHQYLLDAGNKILLPYFIIARSFSSLDSLPPGFFADATIPEIKLREDQRFFQKISNKNISDAVLSLIALFFIHMGPRYMSKFMDLIQLPIESINFADNTLRLPIPIQNKEKFESISHLILFNSRYVQKKILVLTVEKYFEYRFRYPGLVMKATIPYYQTKEVELFGNNESLVFMGQSIFQLMLTKEIHDNHDYLSPTQMSNLRGSIINNENLKRILDANGFNGMLEKGSAVNNRNPMMQKVPGQDKIINSNINFYGIIGALFIDSDGNLEKVFDVLWPHFKKPFEEYLRTIPIYKSHIVFSRYPNLIIDVTKNGRDNYAAVAFLDSKQLVADGPSQSQARTCLIEKIFDVTVNNSLQQSINKSY